MAGPGKAGGGEIVPLRPTRKCPTCGKPSERRAYPFCSRRCADFDLHRWLSNAYAIPGDPHDPESGLPEDPDGQGA